MGDKLISCKNISTYYREKFNESGIKEIGKNKHKMHKPHEEINQQTYELPWAPCAAKNNENFQSQITPTTETSLEFVERWQMAYRP